MKRLDMVTSSSWSVRFILSSKLWRQLIEQVDTVWVWPAQELRGMLLSFYYQEGDELG